MRKRKIRTLVGYIIYTARRGGRRGRHGEMKGKDTKDKNMGGMLEIEKERDCE